MIIVEYDKEWPDNFNKIKKELENNVGFFASIEHIGSTAIKGMCGKPIIDIIIVVNGMDSFNQLKNDLEIKFGYYHVGDWGIDGREVFKRKNSLHKMSDLEMSLLDKNIFLSNGNIKSNVLDTIEHNLYICHRDAEVLKSLILFRDYLNKNHDALLRYNQIKREIIENCGNEDYNKYVITKEKNYSHFFNEIIDKANNEQKR